MSRRNRSRLEAHRARRIQNANKHHMQGRDRQSSEEGAVSAAQIASVRRKALPEPSIGSDSILATALALQAGRGNQYFVSLMRQSKPPIRLSTQNRYVALQAESPEEVTAEPTPEAAKPKPEPAKHYTLKSGVTLSAEVEKVVAKIADKYYSKTKKGIVVTSGTRTASSQASAIYKKIIAGDDIVKLYTNKEAAKQIKKAYDDAVAAKKKKTEITADITKVIEEQIKAGTYISKHLKAGAVDIRITDMNDAQKKEFKNAANEVEGVQKVLKEKKPPHWHLQMK